MEFNVADLVEAAVDRVPEREILVCGPDRLTYAQLDARANRLAHYFLSLGLQRGDFIGIYGFNNSRWVEAMLAAYKIRAVPINVNYRYVEEELLYLFDNADLVALVHDAQFTPRIANVRGRLPKLQHCIAIADGSDHDAQKLGAGCDLDQRHQGRHDRGVGPQVGSLADRARARENAAELGSQASAARRGLFGRRLRSRGAGSARHGACAHGSRRPERQEWHAGDLGQP